MLAILMVNCMILLNVSVFVHVALPVTFDLVRSGIKLFLLFFGLFMIYVFCCR
jgi:hypothetical protein